MSTDYRDNGKAQNERFLARELDHDTSDAVALRTGDGWDVGTVRNIVRKGSGWIADTGTLQAVSDTTITIYSDHKAWGQSDDARLHDYPRSLYRHAPTR